MKIHYDKDVDAVYIELSDDSATGCVETADGINIDTNQDDRIIGIEILNASKKFDLKTIYSYELDLPA
ncbi:MAG: DUF2283 domain-containing protein [Leptospiraceae bacterium]|nr:DUF2283 domain-containing protein [Leptospiraceae bacterium]